MSIETITVTMNIDNDLICTDEGDYSGEHNAQRLEITLNEEFASADYEYHKLAFDTGGMFGKVTSDEITDSQDAPIYRIGNKIYCTLWQQLTASGKLSVQLSAYGESEGVVTCIKKSGVLTLSFKPSIKPAPISPDTQAELIEKISAAVVGIAHLSEQIESLGQSNITAGDFLTLTNDVMSVNTSNSVTTTNERVPTCLAVKTYCDNTIINEIANSSTNICAAVVARLVDSMDSNCIDVFVNHGLVAVIDAALSGYIETMIYDNEYENKYLLIVPMSNPESPQTLYLTTQTYTAGNIYKVTADRENGTEVVTCYDESSFAQLLGLGA